MSSTHIGLRARLHEWAQAGWRAHTGWVLAIFATISFSMAPPLVRYAIVDGFDPVALLVARMILASALLGITLGALDWRKLRLSPRGMAACALVGAVNAAGMVLFFVALGLLEASLASMILALSPPMVLSLLALRGEQLTQRHLVRLGLALSGVYLLVGPSGEVNWVGVALALLATFLFSLQMALTQWTLAPYPTRTVAFYVTAWMTACVVGWWLLRGATWSAPSMGGWLAVIALAIVSTYIARLAFFAAVGAIGGAQVSLLGPVETLLSVTWSVLFLQERLTLWQWLGGGLILISALLAVQRLGRVNLRLPRR
ncbi:DMT family transporter [Caldilinea sp.]|jgi:drug/metabolite transporter (DMT)-like permease|uniref:DMT family transporter n=1 Tax=Caldilinea sp. TaxID=2293560 RepID=UPI002618B0A3|nr:DMT family transporter [uncultured Caldilinea sp.]